MGTQPVEHLADMCHEQWARWMRYLFSKSTINEAGECIIPKELTDRWKRQVETTYKYLSESEKDSDRTEAIKYLELLKVIGTIK